MQRVVLMLTFVLVSSTAESQIVDVTPELFNKMTVMATDSRAKYRTAPEDAANWFRYLFYSVFDDVTSPGIIASTNDLDIHAITPLHYSVVTFMTALHQLEPLPEKPPAPVVIIRITPKTTRAPNVRRVVLFVDEQEVQPTLDDLKPTEFKNGFGMTFQKSAGAIAWPTETFTKPVKLVFVTDGAPIEWIHDPTKPGRHLK